MVTLINKWKCQGYNSERIDCEIHQLFTTIYSPESIEIIPVYISCRDINELQYESTIDFLSLHYLHTSKDEHGVLVSKSRKEESRRVRASAYLIE